MVAIGAASNFSGTINDVKGICSKAHSVDAVVFVDAVHYAPHGLIDVEGWDAIISLVHRTSSSALTKVSSGGNSIDSRNFL